MIEFLPGPLNTTRHPETLPPSFLITASNVRLDRAAVELGPRYGNVLQVPGYNAGDEGRGLFYAEFGGTSEFIAILKRNGDTVCRAYSINPTTGVWTAITLNDGDALPVDDTFSFAQYDGYIYVASANGLWYRKVGSGAAGDEAWVPWSPRFYGTVGGSLGVTTTAPPYNTRRFVTGDYSSISTSLYPNSYEFDGEGAGTFEVRVENGSIISGHHSGSGTQLYWCHVLQLSTALDVSAGDLLFFKIEMVVPNQYNTFNRSNVQVQPLYVKITEDTGAVEPMDVTDYPDQAHTMAPRQVFPGYAGRNTWIMADFGNIAQADRNAVRRVMLWWQPTSTSGNVRFPRLFYIKITPMVVAGHNLEYRNPEGLQYAYTYRRSASGELHYGIRADLPGAQCQGEVLVNQPGYGENNGNVFGGVRPRITAPDNATLAAAGYDQIDIYRFGPSTGKWWRIATGPNTAPLVYDDRYRERDLNTLVEGNINFGTPVVVSSGQVATWKQHLVLALDRAAYISFTGRPRDFMPLPDDIVTVPQASDDNGRTLYVDAGRVQPITAIAPADALYFSTNRRTFAMLGDTASTASPPRLLPVVSGTPSRKGAAPYRGGIIEATPEGLYYIRILRAPVSIDEQSIDESEITKDVRPTWQSFWAGSGNAVVAIVNEEVWVFKGANYIRWAPLEDSFSITTGTFADTIVDCVIIPGGGTWLLTGTGRVVRLAYDANGVAYTQDRQGHTSPVSPTWTATWPIVLTGPARPATLRTWRSGSVAVTLKSKDVKRGEATQVLPDNGEDAREKLNLRPGVSYQLEATGGAADRLFVASLSLEDAKERYGG